MNLKRMTPAEMALVLCISEKTVRKLAKTEQIPCFCYNARMYFDFYSVIDYFVSLEDKIMSEKEELAYDHIA